jgi:hypothetical protein
MMPNSHTKPNSVPVNPYLPSKSTAINPNPNPNPNPKQASSHAPSSNKVITPTSNKKRNADVIATAVAAADDDDEDESMMQLFGNPGVSGESSGKRVFKKIKGRQPPRGDCPLESIVRTGTKGPVQQTMPKYLIGYSSRQKLLSAIYSPLFLHSSSIDPKDEGDALADFRGFRVGLDGNRMPPHYCTFCCCPPTMCHDKVFGGTLELLVLNQMFGSEDCEPTLEEVKDLFHDEYNRVLRLKVCENTRTLDLDRWAVPYCLTANSLGRLNRYVRACDYHHKMNSNITVGRGVPKQGRMFGDTSK